MSMEGDMACVRLIPGTERDEFYIALLADLIMDCREVGLPHPHETALTLIRIIKMSSARL
jgi:hypothetical protein